MKDNVKESSQELFRNAAKLAQSMLGIPPEDATLSEDSRTFDYEDGQVDTHRTIDEDEGIKYLKQTCFGMPEQYEGETTKGRIIYVRLRHSYGKLDIDDKTYSDIGYHDAMRGDFKSGDLKRLFEAAGFKDFDYDKIDK